LALVLAVMFTPFPAPPITWKLVAVSVPAPVTDQAVPTLNAVEPPVAVEVSAPVVVTEAKFIAEAVPMFWGSVRAMVVPDGVTVIWLVVPLLVILSAPVRLFTLDTPPVARLVHVDPLKMRSTPRLVSK
jgi:hypothetical protein